MQSAWNPWVISLAKLTQILKPEIKQEDWVKYYSYFLCYVDDILYIHHYADSMLEWLHESLPFKLGYGKPDMYLCLKLHKTRLHNVVWTWALSPAKYVQEAERNCSVHLPSNYGGKYSMPKKQNIYLRWIMIQSWIPVQS